jgi:hypothetical protein
MKVISINSSARTVIDLHIHFVELKASASNLLKDLTASQKGYFTPNEEKQAKHLLATYQYSRAALFELILELKEQMNSDSIDTEDQDKYFLIGYAAAAILIRAAQFLYETFDKQPIVRDKLNEPDAYLGIPPNFYSNIMSSLIETQNVLDVHYARKYYEKSLDAFKKLAENHPLLLEVLGITEKLSDEIKFGKKGFLKMSALINLRNLVREIEDFTVKQALYSLQELISRGVSKLKTYPFHRPSLPKPIREEILKEAQPGDIFITRKEHQMTNYFLPGYWPHALLYLGDGKVLEALKDGVKVRSIDSAFSVDSIVILRPETNQKEISEAIERGLKHQGKPYDFDFDFKRSDRLVCTEVIYRSYDGIGPVHFELSDNLGRKNLTTNYMLSLALEKEMLSLITVYSPSHEKDLLKGNKAETFLRQVLKIS